MEQLKRLEQLRRRIHLAWTHHPGCPERREKHPRPERCACGMPSLIALEEARAAAIESLRDTKPASGPGRISCE